MKGPSTRLRAGGRAATVFISFVGIATFTGASGLTALAAPAVKLLQRATEGACKISGKITGLGSPLPGTSVTARHGETIQGATSSGVDGAYHLSLPPDTYHLTIEMAGFQRVERDVALDATQPGTSCTQTVDIAMTLRPRATTTPAGAPGAIARGAGAGRGAQANAAGRGGRGAGFQQLEVNADAAGAQAIDTGVADVAAADAPLLLPPGFRNEESSDAIAITGQNARVDNGLLGDRRDALARGEIPPALADLAQQFGVDLPNLEGGIGGRGRPGGPGGPGGRGGPGGLAAGGGRDGGGGARGGGRGGVQGLIGRGGRGRAIQATADYTFGGSALDAAPYQLRADSPRTERPYTRQNFSATLGGPVNIPGIYNGTNRTTFQLQYQGGLGANLFDQYATVPTSEMRAGDFSAAGVTLINPASGLPFANNQIPLAQFSPQALALLQYLPEANLPGTTRNYHYSTTTASENNSFNLRVTHNFTPNSGRGGRGGGRGGGGGGRGGGGFGGRAGGQRGRGTNVTMNVQVQYRRNEGDQTNVFSNLGGHNKSTTLGTPVSLNIIKGGQQHSITVNFSRTTSGTVNNFTNALNVSGNAGIQGISSDSFAWGLPALSFTSISGVRDTTPSRREDSRFSTEYTWRHGRGRHNFQLGGDFRYDKGSSETEANANGAFVFTGLYSSGGTGARGPYDVADFLLGLPQQASVQFGPGNVTLKGRSMSLFAMDDWRARGNLTLNLGLRYELLWPFVEARGQLVNLDVAPGFTAAAPVEAGQVGEFSGAFPAGLLKTDTNNVAPRVGFATRVKSMTLRGGYGISFNSGAYSSMARQMASQPPFAVTNTQIGRLNSMLLMEDALSGGSPTETTNTFGVDKDYVLGRVQTWNADLSKNFARVWSVGATYTETRGSNLDIVRAPNRDASGGLRIDGVQPFTWQSSEGNSVLHSATFRLQRQQLRGLGGQVSYTLARSRDNAPSIGGGGGGGGASAVAQNDQDLESEWALSNFDRRQRLSTQLSFELPFGQNRRWLADGGLWAGLAENWRMSLTFNMDAGTPLTARVRGASRDVAQGTNGALRANYDGSEVALANPTIDQFFNTSAFSVPLAGFYGTSPRNIITGPGSKQLDGQLARDVRLGGNRTVSIQLRATNLLNLVNYTGVDTNVNSPTFGQISNVRGMRSAQLNLRFRF